MEWVALAVHAGRMNIGTVVSSNHSHIAIVKPSGC
jgi:hypothetical protein